MSERLLHPKSGSSQIGEKVRKFYSAPLVAPTYVVVSFRQKRSEPGTDPSAVAHAGLKRSDDRFTGHSQLTSASGATALSSVKRCCISNSK
jgi:hypothetical protein